MESFFVDEPGSHTLDGDGSPQSDLNGLPDVRLPARRDECLEAIQNTASSPTTTDNNIYISPSIQKAFEPLKKELQAAKQKVATLKKKRKRMENELKQVDNELETAKKRVRSISAKAQQSVMDIKAFVDRFSQFD